ncbi:DUF1566 domain-containing protein [bacterium]|nr:DUF1566 domain-containing protein [bacterium]
MKKLQILAVLILSLFFVFSCSINDDDDLVDTYSGDDTDTATDTLPDSPTDTDSTDTTSDTSDTTDTNNDSSDSDVSDSGTGDTVPVNDADPTDTGDDQETPANDNDAQPVSDDDNDTNPGNDDQDISGLPECKFSNPTPCKDSSSGYVWSSKSSAAKYWNAAVEYCDTLDELGVAWRLPEIYELRTLIENCSGTQTGGTCQIAEGCVAFTPCHEGCDSCVGKESFYSKVGDDETLWSATKLSDDNLKDYFAWTLNFHGASFSYADYKATSGDDKYFVRCVKK